MAMLPMAACALAFDSAAWQERHDLLSKEAERLCADYAKYGKLATEPAEGVTVPIEMHGNGRVKTSVFAKRAQFFASSGYFWGEDVTVVRLDDEGQTNTQVEARHCVVDRTTRSGWAEDGVKARHGKTHLEGKAAYLSFAEDYFRIVGDSKVVSEDIKMKGFRL